ncbi:MAG: hypothetical protein HYZ87_04165 [Candidatus Omnitrophica bacterium]|nr:hypothetical protein [Candidatus Omnitrophota bacterium]
MVDLERIEKASEAGELRGMIERHAKYTGSDRARQVLDLWEEMAPKFVKIIPKDYKRVLQALERVQNAGLTGDQAIMAAFEENVRDTARIGGN